MRINEELKKARETEGITQSNVAEGYTGDIRLFQKDVNRYERGFDRSKSNMINKLEAMADSLGYEWKLLPKGIVQILDQIMSDPEQVEQIVKFLNQKKHG